MAFDLDSAQPAANGGFDLSSAKLVGEKPKTTVQRAPKDPTSVGNLVGAAVEPAIAMGTGAVMGPLSGLAGIAGSMLPGPPGQGAAWQRGVAGMAYQPKTEGGRTALGAISYPFEMLAEGADRAGGATSDVTGSPALGAGVNTAIQALPQFFGAKGAQAGMRGFDKVMENVGPELGLRRPPGVPSLSPDVKALADRKIPLTPGEMAPESWISRAEQAAQSIPLFGDSVRGARRNSVGAFNVEAWNDALKPLGKDAPKNMTGQELAEYARHAYNDAYDGLLTKMKGSLDNGPTPPPANALPAPGGALPPPPRPSFRQELDNLMSMASQPGGLPPKELRALRGVIENDIKAKFNQHGLANGETLQAVQSTLRQKREMFSKSNDAYQQQLGQALKELEAATWRMLEEQNPKLAGEKRTIDDGYARFKIAQQAAGAIGNNEGAFKPSTYDRAVRNKDQTKDKRAYSEGDARQQDLSGPGKRVLSDTVADSGTPLRVAVMEILSHPDKALAFASGVGIPLSILYSPMGIALLNRMVTNPPKAGQALGTAMPIGAAAQAQLPPPPQ